MVPVRAWIQHLKPSVNQTSTSLSFSPGLGAQGYMHGQQRRGSFYLNPDPKFSASVSVTENKYGFWRASFVGGSMVITELLSCLSASPDLFFST